jgi:minor extracellular protease Epr
MALMRRIAGGMDGEELTQFVVWVQRQGGQVFRWLPLIGGVAYGLPEGKAGARALSAGAWDENDVRVYALAQGHDGGEQPAWNLVAVEAPSLWDRVRGRGVEIAIVDSGIDLHHPGLPHIADGYNAIDPGQPPEDDNGHGTHVAGIAAGDWCGGSGVAPEATVVPVKVLDSSGSGALSAVVDGLTWCRDRGIPIINMSFGAREYTQTMRAAISALWARGLVIVAAAGNEGPRADTVSFPARWQETMAVAASTADGRIADFSSRGPQVDLAAPGQSIVSTWPGGGTRALSGTSMAAPHVSGGVALLLELGRHLRGASAEPQELVGPVLSSCMPLLGFGAQAQGQGLLQVAAAAGLL